MALGLGLGVVEAAAFLDLPVHPRLVGAVDVHPVDAEVAPARGAGLKRPHQREREKATAVLRPALDGGQRPQVGRFDDLLDGAGAHVLPAGGPSQLPQQAARAPKLLKGRRVQPLDESDQLLAHLLGMAAEGELDAPLRWRAG